MSLRVKRHLEVVHDITEIAAFLANDSLRVANRFVDDVEYTINLIQRMPGIGGLKQFPDARLADVRVCRLKKFKKHLVI